MIHDMLDILGTFLVVALVLILLIEFALAVLAWAGVV